VASRVKNSVKRSSLAARLIACVGAAFLLNAASSHVIAAESAGVDAASLFPVASEARLAGDDQQTRFILDLDQPVAIRSFVLSEPYRVVLDLPQVSFHLPAGAGTTTRGLIKAFRYGLVMPGGSRIVLDLTGPAKIQSAQVLDAANGQPARLVVELDSIDKAAFVASIPSEPKPVTAPVQTASAVADGQAPPQISAPVIDSRPIVVIDPGHGGIDNGTQAGGESEKTLVLSFALALRDRIEKAGKFRVIMTRTDDTFVPLGERSKIARSHGAALFLSIHADALPRREGSAQGATVYTLSEKASDAEAERLAESENKADAIGGVNLTEEPTDVADILIDLAQRETRTFSNHFARLLVGEMKTAARMHKHPLKSAGFKVLKAPDVPSVLLELGYVSDKSDLQQLLSETWRTKTVGAVNQALEAFLARRLVSVGKGN
jgi:N-acetylmuramoyl-L-alanine amidase